MAAHFMNITNIPITRHMGDYIPLLLNPCMLLKLFDLCEVFQKADTYF